MQEIAPQDYERVRRIFSDLTEIHLNVVAVLDGVCPGRVYVDDVARPQTAYLISGDGHYLAGAVDNHAFNVTLNTSLPRDNYFVLFCNAEQWKDGLDIVLKNTYAIRATRRYYTLRQIRIADWRDRIPDGFAMCRVDTDFLERDLKNSGSVMDGLLDEWRSVDAFLERGFGFCLVRGDDIASWSLSDYIRGDRCEMGINTDWDYRRQGLGTLTATASAAFADAQGFSTVGWHCWDNNVGSIGVAKNVGFEKATEYDVFINHWVAENITDMTQGEFRAFAEFYEREFEAQPPTSGFPHVVAAKARALSGDREGCFTHLNKAVDLGWLQSVDHLRKIWPEFFWAPDLDHQQEWQDLVKKLEIGRRTTSKGANCYGAKR